jgi:DNA-binding CsgD family transcriptional regulator/tetratricopeptide (TPR) repeat protein
MVFGRERELARIDEILEAARQRRGGALVIRGDAGIGKSALLEAAVDRARDMRVLRALGVESEVEIAFSGLHQLLRPTLAALDVVPHVQAAALRAALELGADPNAELLAVFGGALSLLAAAAERAPLLCVVDDAHWLDGASAAALTFVARRLDADGVAMLFGARDAGAHSFPAPGIGELHLGGLGRAAARDLLASRLPARTRPLIAEQLVEMSRGSPLALIELGGSLTPAQLAGVQPLEVASRPLTAVERHFLQRLADLPTSVQQALTLVAASETGSLPTISRALDAVRLDLGCLTGATTAGLVTVGSSVEFCHPLARSAIYRTARQSERRNAHQVLAAVAEALGEPDRRAWHLAAAADRPDERIASALVGTAESARRRAGVWSEARALERAASLTPERRLRGMRLVRAGDAAYRAGRLDRAEALLESAVDGDLEIEELAYAQARRAYIRVERGELDAALQLMVGGANDLEPVNARAAATLLTNAATVHYHRLEIAQGTALAERAWRLAGERAMDDAELCHVVSFQRLLVGRVREAMELAWHCAGLLNGRDDGRIVVADAASTLLYGGDVGPARRLFEQAVQATRAAGAFGDLGYSLHMCAQGEWYGGNLLAAYAEQLEALQLVEEVGTAQVLDDCLSRLAAFEAVLGREGDSVRHAERALASAIRLGDRRNEVRARGALGLVALAAGDAERALTQLVPAVAALERGGHRNPNHFRLHPDLVEAYVRLGRTDEASPVLASLERQARKTGIAWTVGAVLRCRGLLETADAAAHANFESALRLHERAGVFEHARTQLCFGEQLRRRGLRRESRLQLGAALEAFDAVGAVPWAERARTQLRASGITVRRRGPGARDQLTPQELQIARLVADGKTNRDVAATLFITQKTVEFHLTRIYRKLEIRSRSELVRRMVD